MEKQLAELGGVEREGEPGSASAACQTFTQQAEGAEEQRSRGVGLRGRAGAV